MPRYFYSGGITFHVMRKSGSFTVCPFERSLYSPGRARRTGLVSGGSVCSSPPGSDITIAFSSALVTVPKNCVLPMHAPSLSYRLMPTSAVLPRSSRKLSRKRIEPIRFSREISGLYFGKNPYNIHILSRIFPSSILTDLYVKTACTLQRANFR